MKKELKLTRGEIQSINNILSLKSPLKGEKLGEIIVGWVVEFDNGVEFIVDVQNSYDKNESPFVWIKWLKNQIVFSEKELDEITYGQSFKCEMDGVLFEVEVIEKQQN